MLVIIFLLAKSLVADRTTLESNPIQIDKKDKNILNDEKEHEKGEKLIKDNYPASKP